MARMTTLDGIGRRVSRYQRVMEDYQMADLTPVQDDSLVRSAAWRDGFLGNFLILLATAVLAKWIFGFAGAVLTILVVGLSLSSGAFHETNVQLAKLRDQIKEVVAQLSTEKLMRPQRHWHSWSA